MGPASAAAASDRRVLVAAVALYFLFLCSITARHWSRREQEEDILSLLPPGVAYSAPSCGASDTVSSARGVPGVQILESVWYRSGVFYLYGELGELPVQEHVFSLGTGYQILPATALRPASPRAHLCLSGTTAWISERTDLASSLASVFASFPTPDRAVLPWSEEGEESGEAVVKALFNGHVLGHRAWLALTRPFARDLGPWVWLERVIVVDRSAADRAGTPDFAPVIANVSHGFFDAPRVSAMESFDPSDVVKSRVVFLSDSPETRSLIGNLEVWGVTACADCRNNPHCVAGADILVGTHSTLSPLLWLDRGATVIEILPQSGGHDYALLARSLGLRYIPMRRSGRVNGRKKAGLLAGVDEKVLRAQVDDILDELDKSLKRDKSSMESTW